MKVFTPDKRESWGTMALKAGRWELLWSPLQAQEMRRMNGTFPIARSKDEARDRVIGRIQTDEEFAQRYEGWTFFFVLLDECVEVSRRAA